MGKPTRTQQMARAQQAAGPPITQTAVCFVCCGNAKVAEMQEEEPVGCALAITWAPLQMPEGQGFCAVPVCMEHLPVMPANQRSLLVAQGRIQ